MSEFQSEQQDQEQRNTPENSISMTNGGNFYFDVHGKQVRVWFSSFSGKKQIYVNDTLVSSNRSWRKMSSHEFTIDGARYKVRLGVRSWSEAFKGIYIAELYREQQLIDQDEICFLGDRSADKPFSWKQFTWELAPWLIAGGLIGFLVGFFGA